MKQVFQQGDGLMMVRKLSGMGVEYFFKSYDTMNYVGYGDTVYVFSKTNDFSRGLFLFGLVRKDFDKWLVNNPEPVFEESYRANLNTRIEPLGKQYSYDISHAFWRIAFIHGYISKNTYDHGLRLKEENAAMKQLYCMALSTQGQSKKLDGYSKTTGTGKTLTIAKNPIHKNIYNDIRYRTFKIMDDLAFLLKKDFVSYNVDCITFVRAKNQQIVENYLKSKNLTFKKIK